MEPKSNYFLYGYFGTGNFGDDILLYSAIKNILARDPRARFLIRNHGPVNLEKDFPGRIKCTDIEKIHYSHWPLFFKFLILMQAYWTYMGQVSTLVIGGGTLIHDSPNLNSTFLLLCLCLVAKIRGRHIIGIGLGTQIIKTRRGKIIMRLMIKLFNQINLRDRRSYDQIKALSGNSSRVVLTTDLAYALPEKQTSHHADKIIAVTLANCLLERLPLASRQLAIATLANALINFIKKGYHIRLLPLQKEMGALGVDGDSIYLEQLQDNIPLPYRQKTKIVTIESNPQSIAAAYDGVCLMIGMRFHSLIFSAIKHVPFIGLADEPKISSICDEFSMPCFAMNDWNEKTLSQAIEESFDKTIDPLLIEELHKLAHDNFGFITQ